MKIAVWHNLPSGGGKRSLYYHVRGLLERGHEIESWCPPTADQTYLPLNKLISEHIVPLAHAPRPTKNKLDILLNSYFNVIDRIEAMDEHCKRCAQEIKKGDFDVLFANPCMEFRVTSLPKYISIPKVLYLQEPYRWLYEALPNLPWTAIPTPKEKWSVQYLKKFVFDLCRIQGLRVQVREEISNAQAYDTILVNSLFSRESILRAYGLNSKLCYLGVDTKLFHPLASKKEKYVMGLGGIYLGKRVDRVIHALATIEKDIRPKLIWVGNFSDDLYLKEMNSLSQSLNVAVDFKVCLSDEELVTLLSGATALVYAPQLEPFGFAPLEANACGTPVVALAEGGVREVVCDNINGLLVSEDDPNILGNALKRLLTQEELLQEMGKQSRKYAVERWGWDVAVERLECELIKIINQKL
ncbi:glycosyltransferase family 4 protein [Anthocerotibacter panamensis]|uniref:glycosyltransferase family 4 protein n=1 Tax=Anthocerotibacter panamensis TaxID=2857077 RepID=UPI001C405A59|nr:glycosyltransferase family 4 protein [Anthocerotibacter panamensis]